MRKISGRFGAVAKVTALMGMMLAAAIVAPAQTFTTLHSFDNTDGNSPTSTLIQATDGNLYGTTGGGGDTSCTSYYGTGCGTVFKMAPGGALTTIYNFCSKPACTDGGSPFGALVQAGDGNFYGVTFGGGANGYGTVFRITPQGALTTLYSFCSQSGCADGAGSWAGLVQGSDGNFYGTTSGLGGSGNFVSSGTVFKVTSTGVLTTLHTFCSQQNCIDGAHPYDSLVVGGNGRFFGTTSEGGGSNRLCLSGCGTVFEITEGGTLTTLHRFDGADGAYSSGGLALGTDGNLYGTTYYSGNSGPGTVFRITRNGELTTLHAFCSENACADGANPATPLIEATDGNFYGVTFSSGSGGHGTAFQITPDGKLTTLYSFCSQTDCADGANPVGAFVQDTSGNLYGSTVYGANNTCGSGCGVIFGLSMGLGPFVKTQPAMGKLGRSIIIMGTNLTGATGVTFNGTAATFTVESPTAIKTTVPTGATTGPVQVVTPSGTLTSNVNFRVLP